MVHPIRPFLALLMALPAVAQDPATLRMQRVGIAAEVVDGVATTTLTLTVANRGTMRDEAIWTLPLARDVAVDGFTLTIDGTKTGGDVLDPHRARRIYDEIVGRRKDPGSWSTASAVGCA